MKGSAVRGLNILTAALSLTGCATPTGPRPEPEVRTVEVKVTVPVPCKALEQLGPEPAYADTDAAIAAATDIGTLAKLYAKGRLQRVQRLAEYVVAKASCSF
jgi:hypothetical protein